jgi:outer membrane protein
MKHLLFAATLNLAILPAWGADGLLDAYRLAAQNDPRLQAAEAGLKASQEGRKATRSTLLPRISASGETGYISTEQTVTEKGNRQSYSLDLTQEIFNYGNSISRSQSDSSLAEAETSYENARQDLMVRLAQSYFGALLAEDIFDLTRTEKNAIAVQLDLAKQRYDAGMVAMSDVHDAQAAYDLAVAQELQREEEARNSLERLSEITGQPHTALKPLRADYPLPPPEPADLSAWLEKSQDLNPALQAARHRTKTAELEIQRQNAGHYPTVNVLMQHAYTDNSYLLNPDDAIPVTASYAAVRLNLPIYEGGRVTAQTDQARYRYQQASQEEERTRRDIQRQLKNAFHLLESGRKRVNTLELAVAAAQKALDATEAGFEAGVRDMTDVLNAQRALYRDQQELAGARYDYVLNLFNLKKQGGVLSEGDIEQLSAWLHP